MAMNRSARPIADAAAEPSSRKATRRPSAPAGPMGKEAGASRLSVPSTAPARRRSAGHPTGAFAAPQKPSPRTSQDSAADAASARPSPSPSLSPRTASECGARRATLGLPSDSEAALAGDSGHQFSVGERCFVGNAMAPGTVRFIGVTQFAEGIWVGVELDEALGKNNGTVRDHQYFDCKLLHGIFCRTSALMPAPSAEAVAFPPRRHGSFSSVASSEHMVPAAAPAVVVSEPRLSSRSGLSQFLPDHAESGKGTPSTATTATKSTPTTTELEAEPSHSLQRELAEAVEEHDAERIQRAIRKAVGGRLSRKELENAQRVLNFELSRSLILEIEDVRTVVANLSDTVRAAGVQASACLPVDKKLRAFDDHQGPSMFTIASMIETSREEIVSRIENHQQQVARDLETVIARATTGIWEAISSRSAGPPPSIRRPSDPSIHRVAPPVRAEFAERGRNDNEDGALEAEALEEGSSDNESGEMYAAPRSPVICSPTQLARKSDFSPSHRSVAETKDDADERLRQSRFRQFDAAARVIQAAWRVSPNPQHIAQRLSLSIKSHQAPSGPAYGEAEQRQALMKAMSHREEEGGDRQASGSDDEDMVASVQQRPPHLLQQHVNRPELSGDWQFSFEGMVHSWHVNGTMAYTPEGMDESGEQLEIVQENGREMLNGWCLMGRSDDGNTLIWEDTESYERVVWVRSGHSLESTLESMEEDLKIHIMDISTGSLLCELLAEKTWLVFDLQEAIQDQIGIHPREQRLAHQGRPLTREDEPLIDVVPAAAGEAAVIVCARVQSNSKHLAPRPALANAQLDEPESRRPSAKEIGIINDAALSAHNAVHAAVRLDPEALRHAPEEMTCDRDLVLAAVQEGAALSSVRPEFQADREIVLAAVQRDGMALDSAALSLQADHAVVFEAIKQDRRALRFAGTELQNDPELLHIAGLIEVSEVQEAEHGRGAENAQADTNDSNWQCAQPLTIQAPEDHSADATWAPAGVDFHPSPGRLSPGHLRQLGFSEEQIADGTWDPDASAEWPAAPGQHGHQDYSEVPEAAWADPSASLGAHSSVEDTHPGYPDGIAAASVSASASAEAWDPDATWGENPAAPLGRTWTAEDVSEAQTWGESLLHPQRISPKLEGPVAEDPVDASWSGGCGDSPHSDAHSYPAWTPSMGTAELSPIAPHGRTQELGHVSPSRLPIPVQPGMASTSSPRSREISPREIIAEQDLEYQESELIDAKKEMDARVKKSIVEVEKKERALEEAESALRNAFGRLERYGANPRVEQERDAAQLQAEEAMESLAKSQEQLEKFSAAASTLDAELVAVRSEQQNDSSIEF